MKFDIFLLVILIMVFMVQIVGADSVIVKYNKQINKGYKDAVKELGLYLFDKGNHKKGYEYIENNYLITAQSADPDVFKQTYLEKLNIKELNLNSSVSVAILDSGVNFKHEDLKGIGDIDVLGHGTAIAGIISGIKNNGKGISGISNSDLISIRVLNKYGNGRYFRLIKGIVKAVNENAKIILISSGGYKYSKALEEAINYANNNGVFVISAGGNTNSTEVLYPAKFDNVISVGSINNEGEPCNYSDWGYKNNKPKGSCFGENVDFMLPGVNIYSTSRNGKYKYFNGTSFSAAILTGIASYIIGNEPDLSLKELKIKLREFLNEKDIFSKSIEKQNKKEFYLSSVSEVADSENILNDYNSSGTTDELFNDLKIIRTVDHHEIFPGGQVKMTLEITNNANANIRGFYLTDEVYKTLTVGTPEATINGASITLAHEIEAVNSIYKNYVPHRFIIETPGFSEEQPLAPGDTLKIEYPIIASKEGAYYFENYSWIGLYKDSPEVSIFGYETSGTAFIVAMPDLAQNASPTDYVFDLEPTFSWFDAGSEFSYELSVYKKIGFLLKKIFSKTEITTNSFDWSTSGVSLNSGTDYVWKIRAVKGDYKGKYTSIKFRTYKFETPFIVSPIGSVLSSQEPTFKWNSISGVTGNVEYKVFLYKYNGKKYELISETEHSTNTANWSDIKGSETSFEIGTKYKWEVGIYYNGELVSKDDSKIFIYYNIDAPIIISPTKFASKLTQNFSWEAPDTANTYKYDLNIFEKKGKKLVTYKVEEDIVSTSVEVTLKANKEYVWSIRAKYNNGSTEIISNSANAYVAAKILRKPVIITPIGTTENLKPVINWYFWDSGETQISDMRFYIEVALGTKKIVQGYADYDKTSFNISDITPEVSLIAGKKYKIKVIAETLDESISTSSKTVTVKAAEVQVPEIVFPVNNSKIAADTSSGIKWKFAWKKIDGITKYKVQIKQGNKTIKTLSEITYDTYSDANYTYCRYYYDNSTELQDGKKYSVNVVAVNSEGISSLLSKTIKFVTYTLGNIPIDKPNSKIFYLEYEKQNYAVFYGSFDAFNGEYGDNLTQQFMLYKKSGFSYKKLTTDWTNFDSYSYNWGDDTDEELLVHNGKYKIEFRCKKTINSVDYYSKKQTVAFKACGASPVYSTISPGELITKPKKYQLVNIVTPSFIFTTDQFVEYSYFEINIIGSGTYKFYGEEATDVNGLKQFDFILPITKKLKPSKKYAWKVRNVLMYEGETMRSAWSEKRYFIPVPLFTPILSYPVQDEVITTTIPEFEMEVDENSTKFSLDLFIYDPIKNKKLLVKIFKFEANEIDQSGIMHYKCPIQLIPGAKYIWRVKAESLNIKGVYSALENFYIDTDAVEAELTN